MVSDTECFKERKLYEVIDNIIRAVANYGGKTDNETDMVDLVVGTEGSDNVTRGNLEVEVTTGKNAKEWKAYMHREYDALTENNASSLVSLSEGLKVVSCC